MKEHNDTFQFWWASYLDKNFERTSLLTKSNAFWDHWMKFTMAYFALCIFPATEGLKKSYQLLIGLNKIHFVIPDIHILQVVVVKQVYRVQRAYQQYLRGKYFSRYCSQFVLLCFCKQWLFWNRTCPVRLSFPFLPALAENVMQWQKILSSTWMSHRFNYDLHCKHKYLIGPN